MELVPLKVQIGLKVENGKLMHAFPDFNQLDPVLRDNMDWSLFIDKSGGWHFDKVAGHMDDDPLNDSPSGTWLGMTLVPDNFAQAAIAEFPDQCSILNETDAETFYNDRSHVREPEIFEDINILQAIAAKRALNLVEDQDDINALDPDHPQLGRRRNPRKTWAQYKTNRSITITQ